MLRTNKLITEQAGPPVVACCCIPEVSLGVQEVAFPLGLGTSPQFFPGTPLCWGCLRRDPREFHSPPQTPERPWRIQFI